MVNCYDCREFVPGGRFVTSWSRKAKEALETLQTVGWASRHRMPFCRHYNKFLHDMPDVDSSKTWLEDVWKIGCDWAHSQEHIKGPGHKPGSVFRTLHTSGHAGKGLQDRRTDPIGIRSKRHGRKVL